MSRADEHELWQDERAADLRERDRSREPHRHPRTIPRAVEIAPRSPAAESVKLTCPQCNGPVFAMSDSNRDRLTCTEPTCGAQLTTRRALDGTVDIILIEIESDEDLIFAGLDEQLTKVGEMIKLDQIKRRGGK